MTPSQAPLVTPDGQLRRLGRNRPLMRPKTLALGSYLNRAGANLPPSVRWSAKAMASLSRVLLNDRLGDCVPVSLYHAMGCWSANESGADAIVIPTDAEVLALYSYLSPGDTGCNVTDVLSYAQDRGLTANGQTYKIDGFVSIDHTSQLEVQATLAVLGAFPLALALPVDWWQSPNNAVWDFTNAPIEGGHGVVAVGYDADYVDIATWGGLRRVTWRAFLSDQWIDEAYAVVSPLWYANQQRSPGGLDVAQLLADQKELGQGVIPDVGPPDPPPTPPGPPPNPPPDPGPTPDPGHWDYEHMI